MTGAGVQLLVGLVLLAVLAAFSYLAVKSPAWTTALLLALFTVTQGIRDQLSLSTSVGGFHIYAIDVFCCVLLLIAAFRTLVGAARNTLLGLIWLMVFLFVVHLGRGVPDFGLQTAITAARPWLYFLAPLVYAATTPVPWDRRVWRLYAVTGLALMAVSIPYLLVDGIQPASHLILRNGQLISNRPITAQGALLVLEAAIILLALRWPSPRGSMVLALLALADIIATEQRTVWVATLAVAIAGFIGWSRRQTLSDQRVVFGATGALLITVPIGAVIFLSTPALRTSLEETTAKTSTFNWRTQSWHELVSSHHSATDVLIGGPAGANWARVINQHVATQAPHDAVVEAFLRFGLPGVVLYCTLLFALWRRRCDIARGSALPASAVALILVAQATFSVTYMLGPSQGLLLGIFVCALSAEMLPNRRPSLSSRCHPSKRIAVEHP